MKYFAAVQFVANPERIEANRQAHLEYLIRMVDEGHIHLRGKFPDGSGGLTIYRADSLDDAQVLAGGDPYVSSGARRLELHEWDMKPQPE